LRKTILDIAKKTYLSLTYVSEHCLRSHSCGKPTYAWSKRNTHTSVSKFA